MATEGARDGLRDAPNASSVTNIKPGESIELKVTSAAIATPSPADADLETGATDRVPKENEIYSVFSKRQRILIMVMTVLGAIVSPISGQI